MRKHARTNGDRGVLARDDLSSKIDARDQRADPGNLAVEPRREAVLEVDARPFDADLDLARRQVGLMELAEATLEMVVESLGDVRTERVGDGGHAAILRTRLHRRGARVGSVHVAADYDDELTDWTRNEDGLDTTASNRPPSPSTWDVPSWLTRLAAIGWRVLVTVAFGAFVVAFAIYLSTVTLSILFAVIAVATLGPFNERMRARGWGGAKAAGGSIGAAVLIVVRRPPLDRPRADPVPGRSDPVPPQGLDRLSAELASANVPADTAAALAEAVQQIEGWLSQQASAIVDSLVEAGTIVMLGLFLTFYLLLDGDKAWDVGLSGLGGWQRDRIRDAGEEAMRRAGGYVRGTAVIASVDALSSFVVLTLIGVSLAGPLAVLVLAAGFVPYIGGLFVAGILLLAGLALGGVPTALLLVLIVVVLKVVEKRRLARFLSDRTLQLHPAVILLALLVGFTLGGLAGMFVAVPTIAVVVAIAGAVLDVLGTTGTVRVSMRGRHPDLARPSGAMELAAARRRRLHRTRGRHPVAVPGRGRSDRRRGHPGRDVPAGGRGARAAGLDPGPCVVRGQHPRVGDRGGRDIAVRSRPSAGPSRRPSRAR